jgi:hypothetical protein
MTAPACTTVAWFQAGTTDARAGVRRTGLDVVARSCRKLRVRLESANRASPGY